MRRAGSVFASVRWFSVALIAIVGLAAFLRFSGLDRREPWLDENCTFFLIDEFADWGAVGERWNHEVAHLPYVFLLKGWSLVVGDTMWHLRAWSALVGTATVLAVAGLAAAIAGRRAALIAALLLAVHPLHIHYSQEARVYATWMFVMTGTLYALYRAGLGNSPSWWTAYAVSALLAVLVHYYSLFWMPLAVCAVFVATARREFVRKWLFVHVVMSPVLAAIVWWLVIPLGGSGPRWWLVAVWSDRHPAQLIAQSIWAMLPAGGYPDYLGALSFAHHETEVVLGTLMAMLMRWVPALVTLLVFLGSLCMRTRRVSEVVQVSDCSMRGIGAGRRGIVWLILHSLGFLAAIWIYSYVVDPAYVVARYDLAVLPAFIAAIALGIDRLIDQGRLARNFAGNGVGAAATGLLVLCSILVVHTARAAPAPSEMTLRARHIAAVVAPNDLVISLGGFRWFVDYAWKAEGIRAELRSFPEWHDGQLCWDNPEAELRDPQRIHTEVERTVAGIREAIAIGRRVFVLAHGEPEGPRWEVDRQLFAALHASGLTVNPIDEWAGLGEVSVEFGGGGESQRGL